MAATLTYKILKELNIIAWSLESQFMEASQDFSSLPLIHSKGIFLVSFEITSNVELGKIQNYIDHYTTRIETAGNTTLVKNELLKIYEKAKSILEFYNENLTLNSKIVKQYLENMPKEFKSRLQYFNDHTGKIITMDLCPLHIVFGEDCKHPSWNGSENGSEFNYSLSNKECAIFCNKLVEFIEDLEIVDSKSLDKMTKKDEKQLSNNNKTKKKEVSKPKLSLQEFGLKLAFEERQVTSENRDEIVQEIGLESGQKLYQWYNKYASRANRKGKPVPYTLTTLNNKIKMFEKVIDSLNENYKAKAIDELKILHSFRNSDFQ